MVRLSLNVMQWQRARVMGRSPDHSIYTTTRPASLCEQSGRIHHVAPWSPREEQVLLQSGSVVPTEKNQDVHGGDRRATVVQSPALTCATNVTPVVGRSPDRPTFSTEGLNKQPVGDRRSVAWSGRETRHNERSRILSAMNPCTRSSARVDGIRFRTTRCA